MPYDPRSFGDDDEESEFQENGRRRRFREFDCPECAANNPLDDGFVDGDEVLCNYCGQELRAQVSEEGKLRLRVV
ncbi:MAG TPA: hypothetical protein VFK85_12355 [Anaeromyxobacteraceae bacterium]|nr:hypothetical protein [Anaeromyxobacteraceae bacterium]